MTEPKPTTTVLLYFRRNPKLTLQEMYDHWATHHARICAPWMEKHGWLGYRQIQATGTISLSKNEALPHFPTSNSQPTGDLFHFDGIAFFEVPRHVNFVDAFSDPYYAKFIEPDENRFVDKASEHGGILATYEGRTVTLVDHGETLIGEEGEPERKAWAKFEEKAKAKIPTDFRARL